MLEATVGSDCGCRTRTVCCPELIILGASRICTHAALVAYILGLRYGFTILVLHY